MKAANILRLGALAIVVLAACSDSKDAQEDLNDDEIPLETSGWTVYLNYDAFPNVAAKCDGTTRMYATTRSSDSLIVVPESNECEGGRG